MTQIPTPVGQEPQSVYPSFTAQAEELHKRFQAPPPQDDTQLTASDMIAQASGVADPVPVSPPSTLPDLDMAPSDAIQQVIGEAKSSLSPIQYAENIGQFIRNNAKEQAYALGEGGNDKLSGKMRANAARKASESFPGLEFDKTSYDKYVKYYGIAKTLTQGRTMDQEFKDRLLAVPEEDRDLFISILSETSSDLVPSTATGITGGLATTLQRAGAGIIENTGKTVLRGLKAGAQREDSKEQFADWSNDFDYVVKARNVVRGADKVVGEGWGSKSLHGAVGTLPYMMMLQATASNPASYFALGAAQMAPDIQDQMQQAGVPETQAYLYSIAAAVAMTAIEKFEPGELSPTKYAGGAFREWAKKEMRRLAGESSEEFYQEAIELAAKAASATTSKGDFDWNGEEGEWSTSAEGMRQVPGVVAAVQAPSSIVGATVAAKGAIDESVARGQAKAREELLAVLPEKVRKRLNSKDPKAREWAESQIPIEIRDALSSADFMSTEKKQLAQKQRDVAEKYGGLYQDSRGEVTMDPDKADVSRKESVDQMITDYRARRDAATAQEEAGGPPAEPQAVDSEFLGDRRNAVSFFLFGSPEYQGNAADPEAGRNLQGQPKRRNVPAHLFEDAGIPGMKDQPGAVRARQEFSDALNEAATWPIGVLEDIAKREMAGTLDDKQAGKFKASSQWQLAPEGMRVTKGMAIQSIETPYGTYVKLGKADKAATGEDVAEMVQRLQAPVSPQKPLGMKPTQEPLKTPATPQEPVEPVAVPAPEIQAPQSDVDATGPVKQAPAAVRTEEDLLSDIDSMLVDEQQAPARDVAKPRTEADILGDIDAALVEPPVAEPAAVPVVKKKPPVVKKPTAPAKRPMEKGLVDASEAAEFLGVTEADIQRMANEGKLKAYKDGNSVKFIAKKVRELKETKPVSEAERDVVDLIEETKPVAANGDTTRAAPGVRNKVHTGTKAGYDVVVVDSIKSNGYSAAVKEAARHFNDISIEIRGRHFRINADPSKPATKITDATMEDIEAEVLTAIENSPFVKGDWKIEGGFDVHKRLAVTYATYKPTESNSVAVPDKQPEPTTVVKPKSFRAEKAEQWLNDAIERRPAEADTPEKFAQWLQKGFPDDNYRKIIEHTGQTLEEYAAEKMPKKVAAATEKPKKPMVKQVSKGQAALDAVYPAVMRAKLIKRAKDAMRQSHADDVEVSEMPRGGKYGKAMEFVARTAKRRGLKPPLMLIYDGKDSPDNGIKIRGAIAINDSMDTESAIFWETVAHETAHSLDIDRTKLSKATIEEAKRKYRENIRGSYPRNIADKILSNKEAMQQEAVAWFAGKLFTDKKFRDAVEKKNPGIIDKVKEILRSIFEKIGVDGLLDAGSDARKVYDAFVGEESSGSNVPADVQSEAARIMGKDNTVTVGDADRMKLIIEDASSMLKSDFAAFLGDLGLPNSGTKKAMKEAAIGFVNQLSRTYTQTLGEGSAKDRASKPRNIIDEGVTGDKATLALPDKLSEDVTYLAVEASDITPSHDVKNRFAKNPGGDKNEKPYHDPKQGREPRAKVEEIALAKGPEFPSLVSDDVTVISGPPVLHPDGAVLGGNARSMGVQLAYHNGGDAAVSMKGLMVSAADKFGIDKDAVEGMAEPIIVRVMARATDKGEMSKLLNETLQAGMTNSATAASRGAKVSDDTISIIADKMTPKSKEDSPTIRNILADASKASLIIENLKRDGALTNQDLAQYLEDDGTLNGSGKLAIESLLVGSIVGDPSLLGKLSNRSVSNLLSAIGPLTRILKSKKNGAKFKKILDSMIEALPEFTASKKPARQYFLQQKSMFEFEGSGDKIVAMIAGGIRNRGTSQFRSAMNDVAKALGLTRKDKQLTMLDQVSPTEDVADAIEEVFLDDLGKGFAGDLLDKKTDDVIFRAAKEIDRSDSKKYNPKLVALAAEYVKYRIEEGIYTFADIVQTFIDKRGEAAAKKFEPYLKMAWDDARVDNLDKPMDDTASVDEVVEEKNNEDRKKKPSRIKAARTSEGDTTSIKNRKVNERREERGVPPLVDPEAESQRQWMDMAENAIREEPGLPERLVKELRVSSRPINKMETAAMQIRYRDLNNAVEAASKRIDVAHDKGDMAAVAAARMEMDTIMVSIVEFEEAVHAAGTEWGRAGVARQIELLNDYSIAALLRRAAIAKGDSKFTSEERAQLEQLAKDVKILKKRLDAKESLDDEQAVKDKIDDDIKKQRRKKKPKEKVSGKRDAKKKKVSDAWAKFNKAAAKIKLRSNPLIVPLDLIAPAIEVIEAYVELGIATLPQLFSRIKRDGFVDDIDAVKDTFEEAWKRLHKQGAIPPPISDISDMEEIGQLARDLMRWAVESGVTEREAVVDIVHAELLKVIEVTRRQTMDAMSGYGAFTELSKDDTDVKLRDIRGQLQQLAKLDDMEKGVAPAKTGREQREASDDERNLISLVREAMRKGGYLVTDPAKQLATALGAAKKAVRNRIADMEKEIRTREKIVKQRTVLKPDAELKELIKQRDALKKVYDAVFPKTLTKEQRIDRSGKALDRAINQLETEIENGINMPGDSEAKVTSPELDAKRDRLAELKATRSELRKNNPKYVAAVEERQLAAYKRGVLQRQSKLSKRIAENDFAPVEKKERKLDKETLEMLYQYDSLKRKFRDMQAAWNRKRLKGLAKAWDNTAELMRTSRSLVTSFDWSAIMRQASSTTFSHPIRTAMALPATWRATLSREGAFNENEKIRNRPNHRLYQQAGLELAELDGKLSSREEAYMSHWSQYIPGVAASERAYVTFLNRIRADVFDMLVASNGNVSLEQAKILANLVNVATGRGAIHKTLKGAAVPAATLLFSPRYVVSRFQLLLLQPLWKPVYRGEWKIAKAIAKEYGRALMGRAAFYTLMYMWGMGHDDDDEEKPKITFDPRSSDYGKIRINDVRIDPMGGLSQVTVLLARIATGERVTQSGAVIPLRGDDVPYMGMKIPDVVWRFGRSKLAPVFTASLDLISGEDLLGDPITPWSAASGFVAPLSLQDIYSTMVSDLSVPKKVALSMVSIFGISLQSYEQGDLGEFYAERYKLRDDKKKQGEDFKNAEELRLYDRFAGMMKGLRALAKDMEAEGKDTSQVELYSVGAARFAMGLKDVGRYPNPYTHPATPQEIRDVVNNHLARSAYTLAITKDMRKVKQETIDSMMGAKAYLKAVGIDTDELSKIMAKEMIESYRNQGKVLRASTLRQWQTRLHSRLQAARDD